MRKVAVAGIILCALAILTWGWGIREEPADFTYVCESDPPTLDPALMTTVQGGRLGQALFEGLTTYNPKDLSPLPGVAKSWDINDDGLIYTFHLRKCQWSDGTPVTAGDFVYSWRRVLTQETAAEYAYQLFYIENAEKFYKGDISDFADVGIRAVDPQTLRVTLRSRTPFFLALTSFSTYLPVNKACVEKHGDRWTRPENMVSNGPFKIQEWLIGRRIRLVKNHNYWDSGKVRLNIIDALPVESRITSFNLYETGVVDMVNDVPLAMIDLVKDRKDFHSAPYLGTYFYRFNVTKPPMDDPRVRKALNCAVNKERVVKHVTRGGQMPARSFVPPGILGYSSHQGLRYDPAMARRLLADAGYPGGKGFPSLTLIYNTSESHKQIAEVIQQMWKTELGISVNLLNQEWKVYLDTVKTLNYDVARGGWIGDYTDPNTFLDMFVTNGGNNRTGWSNKKYDDLISAAAEEPDSSKRVEIFREAEKILVDEKVPILPIYFYVSLNMYRSNVKGVYPNIRNIVMMKHVSVDGD